MSSLEKLASKYDESDLKILLINVGEDKDTVAAFMSGRGYTNTALLDVDSEAAKAYRAIGIPIAYLVDKQGTVTDRLIGYVDWNSTKIRSMLDALIGKQ